MTFIRIHIVRSFLLTSLLFNKLHSSCLTGPTHSPAPRSPWPAGTLGPLGPGPVVLSWSGSRICWSAWGRIGPAVSCCGCCCWCAPDSSWVTGLAACPVPPTDFNGQENKVRIYLQCLLLYMHFIFWILINSAISPKGPLNFVIMIKIRKAYHEFVQQRLHWQLWLLTAWCWCCFYSWSLKRTHK